LRPNEIITRVLRFYYLDRKAFLSECRYKEYVRARDVFVWIARERLKLSYQRIGRVINRHHTTIIMAHKRASRLYENSSDFREEIQFIEAMIRIGDNDTRVMTIQ